MTWDSFGAPKFNIVLGEILMIKIVKKRKEVLEERFLELLKYGVVINPEVLTDKVFKIVKEGVKDEKLQA
ncbi:hypothetical protein CP985_10950 [Malaciobacter mytili LMG 24559]|uniref:Uncharacterized protein n=2 Tax=Malaciobacter mytili TaxID=603050 RepID=A0AAX2AHK4_9BACT|nr:hypothetical protein AMYT_a0015 [Malaciobacter mytili LMG 24559]RXK14981.1 hypothetical protein CP985_10950 [Malaciobacter mytili LMG 24559]